MQRDTETNWQLECLVQGSATLNTPRLIFSIFYNQINNTKSRKHNSTIKIMICFLLLYMQTMISLNRKAFNIYTIDLWIFKHSQVIFIKYDELHFINFLSLIVNIN